ncbi:PAS domain-containing protein [Desulforhabdus amnigena]|uniref:histidine kinase n=1 Tax=Desulforhabdus amnigena TaxID=40218 RepID=A0A9W6D504_9BACT|nr:PAS domain-containing protein [Desulforhabdus amnigena]NLJ26633.1 PAS domain-containing protein [Deltaproteobacteria bacterium]GLI34287.1 hypothetical protein DAMNIGENAA_17200 [Desulforhabdus amnigena]
MLDPGMVLIICCLYMGFLFLIALWTEWKSATGKNPANHPVVYSLSLAVYLSSWTYYGSVGMAARSGMLFATFYLGSTIVVFLWWTLLRKMVHLKTMHHITSIADFISARYSKSRSLAALATLIALVGTAPYIALQLKAIISTFRIITHSPAAGRATGILTTSWITDHVGLTVVGLMTLFTIIFGARRLDPTERHEGMVMALSVECIVKWVAFIAVGIFVTYFLYTGFGDIFQRLRESPSWNQDLHNTNLMSFGQEDTPFYSTWMSYFILSMSAVLFLPRQFHVAVVENFDEKHILTAMWLFPLYMILINIFVVPIAIAGLLKGYPVSLADAFVLILPLNHGEPWMALLAFIGGFSAAAGMIMISAMTMSTMIANHLLLPLLGWLRPLSFLKRHLLRCRWVAVTAFLLMGYWFEERIGESYVLINMGLIAFAAVLQFAPAMLGGLFWRRGNKAGAMLGLSAGFLTWAYTLLIPSFAKSGWISQGLLQNGPWGIELLKPEHLFGLTGLDPVSHTVFWTLLFNIGFYVLGSLCTEQSEEDRGVAEEFVGVLTLSQAPSPMAAREAYIDMGLKRNEVEALLSQYFNGSEVSAITEKCLCAAGIAGKDQISITELLEFHNEVEKSLAGSIGSAEAHKAVSKGTIFTPRETRELSEVYEEFLSNLKITSPDLKRKIEYYQERIRLAEERYLHLVRHSPSLIYMLRRDFNLDFINQACSMMLGYTPEEAMSTPHWFLERIHPDDQLRIKDLFMAAFKTCELSFSAECRLIHKNGHSIHAIIKSIPFCGWEKGHEVERLEGIIVDITDRVFLEKALVQKETLNALGAISLEVAHEIRNPLMSIGGFARRLQKKMPELPEPHIILREAERLEKLLGRIRDYLRPIEIRAEEASINDTISQCLELLAPEMNEKGVTSEIHLDSRLPHIYTDPEILIQIFTVLIRSALQAMTKGGIFYIKTFESDQNIHIEFRHEVGKARFKEPDLLFLPFDEGAQNIGLPLCYRLLKYLDGLLSFTTEQNHVVFTVSLPKRAQ